MKRLPFVLLLFSFTIPAFSQFGNEWIRYDQQYLRINIVQDGIYRIDSAAMHAALAKAGISLAAVNPQDIMMFGKQKQLAIHVEGEADGSFDGNDYVEFFARRNDGWYDTEIYEDPDDRNNPYYSLYNDTLTYYLSLHKSGTPPLRMTVETDVQFGNYAQADYFWDTRHWEAHHQYYFGAIQNTISSPKITAGEGWFDGFFQSLPTGNTRTRSVSTSHHFAGGPDAWVEMICATKNDPQTNIGGADNQHIELSWGANANVALDTLFKGYALIKKQFNVPNAGLTATFNGHFTAYTSVHNISGAAGHLAPSCITIRYPHTWDMENQWTYELEVPHNTTSPKSHIRFSNFAGTTPLLYADPEGHTRRIPLVASGSTFDAVVPNLNGQDIRCYLTDDSHIISLSEAAITPVTNDGGYFSDFLQINLDSAYIILTHPSLRNDALVYANYRDQMGYNTLLVDVEELYHQFGAGIVKHPEGIKKFLRFAWYNFPTPPSYAFILGKSIQAAGEPHNVFSRSNTTHYANNLVPSYGYPCSDILYVTDLDTMGDLVPEFPIGRLSAVQGSQIIDYKNKVDAFENAPLAEWRKRLLHFGGGATPSEQASFAGYLAQFESIIEDSLFGGNVHTFLKESSVPIEVNLSDSVEELIESGVSVMTFFGHASGSGFDQSIDNPANYDNFGKYPLVIGNSCYSGDMHHFTNNSTSETWVNLPNRGMIGFIASVKQALDIYLYQYSLNLYANMAHRSYGTSIGTQMQKTIGDLASTGFPFQIENICTSMTLQGDPALKIHSPDKPDLDISASRIYFDPPTINTYVDSFDVHIVVANRGKSVTDPFQVRVEHHLPDGHVASYSKLLPRLHFRDTVVFRIPVDEVRGQGLNEFDVFVDIPNLITEIMGYEEVNNAVYKKSLLISTGGIVPVYPYEYAIVPDAKVVLKASSGDVSGENKTYIFELDTTDEFNTPFKIPATINAPGGVVSWVPVRSNGDTLQLTDSTVYFWRVAEDTSWKESSFQYIKGRRGWGQAHYFQFKNNNFNLIGYHRTATNRTFDFVPASKALQVSTHGWDTSDFALDGSDFEQTGYSIDGAWIDGHGCNITNQTFLSFQSFHLAIIDSVTLDPWYTYGPLNPPANTQWANADHQFGNENNGTGCNTRHRPEGYFVYRQHDATSMAAMDSLINHTVENGQYIALWTWGFLDRSLLDTLYPPILNTLQNLGAHHLPALDSVPYIFFVKKGTSGTAVEIYGNTPYEDITLTENMFASYPFGTITSEVAGPSRRWRALHWEAKAREQNTSDSTTIRLIGKKASGQEIRLAEWPLHADSVIDLDQFIDAEDYPYARLEMFSADDSLLTPSQMQRWQLVFDPVPEAALNPTAGNVFHADTVQEGEPVNFGIAIENISEFDMDSLLVHYWVEDKNRIRHEVPYNRQAPLLAGTILYDTIRLNTVGLAGTNFLWMEVNPVDSLTGFYDQLEQYHFNNLAVKALLVESDRINPVLDVTFDGIHIMDGEVVSATPDILISLDDENPYLILNEEVDTANFEVYLSDPDGHPSRLYFKDGTGKNDLLFIPAAASDNKCKIGYHPTFTQDGVYQLRVRASDKSGNASGNVDYIIHFEIITRSTVTEVLNYPNPFSTRTRFVFTLTGSEPPPFFKIQIMTVTGRVVREITQDELGTLRIGRNITDFAWDGTDEFGDRLAIGVYLYRVVVRDDNLEDVEVRSTAAARYFHKGMGKMYLIR